MERNRIKTALEIALEKAERLGSASSEDLRRQEEEKHFLIGKGLADRYQLGLPLRDVEDQLARYSADAGKAVRRGLFEGLASAISPQDWEKASNSLLAIAQLAPSEQVRAVARRIERLQEEFVEGKQSELAELRARIETEYVELLAARGVAGSAVRPNVDVMADWLRAQSDYESSQDERLAPLREELKGAIQI